MNEPTTSSWQNIWGQPRRFFTRATILCLLAAIGFGLIVGRLDQQGKTVSGWILSMVGVFFTAFILSLAGLVLSAIPRTRPASSWILRRWFFSLAALMTLI